MGKKWLLCVTLVCVLLLGVLLLLGRGAKPGFSVDDVDMLLDSGAFGDMEELEEDALIALYGVDPETVLKCVGYLASNTSDSADELVLFILRDEDAAAVVETSANRRVDARMEECRTSCPNAVPRLEEALVERRDNTVLVAVGDAAFVAELLAD